MKIRVKIALDGYKTVLDVEQTIDDDQASKVVSELTETVLFRLYQNTPNSRKLANEI